MFDIDCACSFFLGAFRWLSGLESGSMGDTSGTTCNIGTAAPIGG